MQELVKALDLTPTLQQVAKATKVITKQKADSSFAKAEELMAFSHLSAPIASHGPISELYLQSMKKQLAAEIDKAAKKLLDEYHSAYPDTAATFGYDLATNPDMTAATLVNQSVNPPAHGATSPYLYLDKSYKPDTIPPSNPMPGQPAVPAQPAKKGNMNELSIFRFGPKTDGNADMKDVLGGKGAGLAEMSKLGIPVPPGFTIPCEASVLYNVHGDTSAPADPDQPFTKLLLKVEALIEEGDTYLTKHFGYAPLVSVRSGARVSMPGMMDTILNVGLTDETLPEWEKRIGVRAARDSYRRLIQMYGSVALGLDLKGFEHELMLAKKAFKVEHDSQLDADALIVLIGRYKEICAECGTPFPQKRGHQLLGAALAVFKSWNNQRAKDYRKEFNIPDDWGTAVTIQSMVFGNMNDKSATGVAFSRDPATGADILTGDFLVNAQGEDVVAGIRTPEPIAGMKKWNLSLWSQLETAVQKLEHHYKDMQDIEFTVQDGKLYLLQCRTGKRSARAAFKIAHDLVQEGLITQDEACQRVHAKQFLTMLRPSIDLSFKRKPDLTGIAAGGGVVSGKAVFTAADAVNCTEPCILIRHETDPDDFAGMAKAVGILTATGGLTSHAAVVARGMDKSCVVGATGMKVHSNCADIPDSPNGNYGIKTGNRVTIDGATGNVWIGVEVPVVEPYVSPEVREVIGWMSDYKFAERLHFGKDDLASVILLSQSPSLYIDLCLLPHKPGSEAFSEQIAAMVNAINQSKASQIVIDLCPLQNHYEESDLAFLRLFGQKEAQAGASAEHAMTVAALSTFAADLWQEQAKKRVLLKLPDGSKFVEPLRKRGFKVLGSIRTVADLLNSDGLPQHVTPEVIETVFGGAEAFDKIKELAGIKGGSVPLPGYWYQPIFDHKGA